MTNSFDLITIGDSTVDTFIKIKDATVECDVNRKDCKICLPYGGKVPVEAIEYAVAGNAANVAVGAKKLGLTVAIYTNLGGDDQGRRIQQTLEEEGVSQDYVEVHSEKKSNLSVVLSFQGERTIFVYHQDWLYRLPKLSDCNWLYLTSMAESFTSSNIMDEVCHFVDKSKTKLVYSPGTFQLKADIKRYPKVLERCELLIVNMEEAKRIMGIDLKERVEMRDLLSKMLLLGARKVVITDGEEGSWATDGNNNLKAGIFPTQLVEKTGAGDAYSSGFVAALAKGETLGEAMIWGTINAAHEIKQVGTQKGILTLEELVRTRAAVPKLVAVNI
ncbi:MAG: carbohydrate kinase family protein [Candidatus Curtissbacteria bacterium]|nr:carbohydrate kinase family protein [Candidatus Curtissbacteria bacterium]